MPVTTLWTSGGAGVGSGASTGGGKSPRCAGSFESGTTDMVVSFQMGH